MPVDMSHFLNILEATVSVKENDMGSSEFKEWSTTPAKLDDHLSAIGHQSECKNGGIDISSNVRAMLVIMAYNKDTTLTQYERCMGEQKVSKNFTRHCPYGYEITVSVIYREPNTK